jgi:DNA-directed RNA polymerase subunit M/transcription elongation factor TFIIS
MGIRFFCPGCDDRMNVKSFLAGKRGICPKCDAKFDIPTVSDPRAEQKNAKNRRPKTTKSGSETTSPADVATITPVESVSELVIPTLAEPALQVSKPSAATKKVTIADDASANEPATAHPTSEDPSKVWYVRPRTGGEFGPADGALMQRWLVEGRVASDSLVWREGWVDWKNAGLVFSDLNTCAPTSTAGSPLPSEPVNVSIQTKATSQTDDEEAIEPIEKETKGKGRPAPSGARRASGRGKWTAIVVALSILAIGLLIVLIRVLPSAL